MNDIVALLRPTQWVKNAVVLAPLIFSQRFFSVEYLLAGATAAAAFCFASSATYAFNDVVDRERDRTHPLKSLRPVASGAISVPGALTIAAVLLALSLGLGAALGPWFVGILLGYVALQVLYSTVLKHVVVLDVAALAGGFVLRAAAGVVAADARVSPWLFACTFLLALFLALGKRLHELVMLGDSAGEHREVLGRYSEKLLDRLVAGVALATVGVYTLYCLSPAVSAKLGEDRLYYTLPFVVFGVFRYLFLVYGREQGGNPTAVLLGDRPLQAGIVGWIATVFLLLYR